MPNVITLERGALPKLIVLTIKDLGRDAYATNIDLILSEKIGRVTMLQQIHTALKRLEKQGAVEVVGKDAGEHRRRPRTIYGLTKKGLTAIEDYQSSTAVAHGGTLLGAP